MLVQPCFVCFVGEYLCRADIVDLENEYKWSVSTFGYNEFEDVVCFILFLLHT
jgi:hypothetical protein